MDLLEIGCTANIIFVIAFVFAWLIHYFIDNYIFYSIKKRSSKNDDENQSNENNERVCKNNSEEK